MKIGQQGGQTADVIFVGVGESHGVECYDAAIPQIGGDHVFADIKLGVGLVAEGGDAAAIHKQGFSIGQNQQDAIALTDIDDAHFQLAAVQLGWKRVPDQEREQG